VTPQASGKNLTLAIPPDPALAGLVLGLSEAAERLFDLERADVLRLTLAMEELFLYACQVADAREPVSVNLGMKGPSARAEFRFRAAAVDPRYLNFAARVSPEQAGAVEMGLFLASRATDQCTLVRLDPQSYLLAAEVDRTFPEAEPIRAPLAVQPPFQAQPSPSEEVLRHAAMLGAGLYPARLCPHGFRTPGRLLAQVRAGLRSALAVVDAAGRPAGLMLWRISEGKAALFSGPYVFAGSRREEIARLLADGIIQALARTGTLSVVSERATPDVPPGYFEPLGFLNASGGEAGGAAQPSLFRSLEEDRGAVVWAHETLAGFLRGRYADMAFAREILDAPGRDGSLQDHSLLATRAERRHGLAVLRAVLDGRDLAANLSEHVQALRAMGVGDVQFRLDLGQAWQAALAQDLARAGFEPRLVLPHAGTSDLLVFEHVAESR
jgi:hypothetical protein